MRDSGRGRKLVAKEIVDGCVALQKLRLLMLMPELARAPLRGSLLGMALVRQVASGQTGVASCVRVRHASVLRSSSQTFT